MVRRATNSDVDALVSLRADMFAAMGVPQTDPMWQTHAAHWFANRIDHPDYCFVVVEVDGVVVSCAAGAVRDAAPSPAVPQGRDILVSNVSTAPVHRGLGHGRVAFETVMDWAHQCGVGRAELMATAPGRDMYEGAGFRETTSTAMRVQLSSAHREVHR